MKEIRLAISIKTIKIALYFALLYFAMQLLSVYECIRHYKFIQLLKEALEREEKNVDWIENVCEIFSFSLYNFLKSLLKQFFFFLWISSQIR